MVLLVAPMVIKDRFSGIPRRFTALTTSKNVQLLDVQYNFLLSNVSRQGWHDGVWMGRAAVYAAFGFTQEGAARLA